MEYTEVREEAFSIVPSLPGEIERAGSSVSAARVVNSLNKINFRDGHVYVKLRHVWNNSYITAAAKPGPGDGSEIRLSWDGAEITVPEDISPYEYCGLFYSDGMKMVWVRAEPLSIDMHGMVLSAPEGGYEVGDRNCRRYRCLDISARITQGILCLQGKMKDYSGVGFAVEVPSSQVGSVRKLQTGMPVKVLLENGEDILLEATCRIIRATAPDNETTLIIAPVSTNIKMVEPKQFRCVRQKLVPQPYIEFYHPFLGKKISLKAVDISGAGIAVEEDPANSLLIPGMVIPEMSVTLANSFKINCRSQVLYNRFVGEGDSLKTGIAFTDMSSENQLQLASILYQAKNERSYVGTAIDLDDLWDFFFETGFIYPKKYISIEEQKEKFKVLYDRLYNGCPDIARHIIYRDKGVVYGHVSMFRYYRRSWLLHHHAAVKSSQHKAGLVVMDHILQHINEVHRFDAAAMSHIACYFRPNNRFANRVFGGASKSLEDPRKSSLDEFAYFHHAGQDERALPAAWLLGKSTPEDFEKLKSYYDEISGGLMLDCLELGKNAFDEDEINSSYKALGLTRERRFYSLTNEAGRLTAIFVLNFSDVGLNMSSLVDCIQVFVVDPEKVETDKIECALDRLGKCYEGKTPVLLFPRSYADDKGFGYENTYILGVLKLKYINDFLGYMEGLTKSQLRLAKK